jgi:hypothetical protein
MTLCIYLWDVLYAIATDPGTIAMSQGFRFSMKIQGFTGGISGGAVEVRPLLGGLPEKFG